MAIKSQVPFVAVVRKKNLLKWFFTIHKKRLISMNCSFLLLVISPYLHCLSELINRFSPSIWTQGQHGLHGPLMQHFRSILGKVGGLIIRVRRGFSACIWTITLENSAE